MTALGIDLGTGYTRAATLVGRTPALVQDSDGTTAIPSVVCFDRAAVRVGRAAVARAAMHPDAAIRGVRWLLGRSHDDPLLDRGPVARARIAPTPGGRGLLLHAANQTYAPEAVAAHLFRQLAELAERRAGGRPTRLVITTPPWTPPGGREALRLAAIEAGLMVDRVITDAAAIALTLPAARQAAEQLVLIADAGAGGVSASVLRVRAAEITLITSAGDAEVGGDDVDRALVRATIAHLGAQLPGLNDPRAQLGMTEMLRQIVETMKRDLSEASEASAMLPFLPGSPALTLDRRRLTPALAELERRLAAVITRALTDAGVPARRLDAAYVTGGMTQAPSVRACVERALGRAPSSLHGAGGAALGAALLAGMLTGEIPSVPVTDAAPPRKAARPISEERPIAEGRPAILPPQRISGEVVIPASAARPTFEGPPSSHPPPSSSGTAPRSIPPAPPVARSITAEYFNAQATPSTRPRAMTSESQPPTSIFPSSPPPASLFPPSQAPASLIPPSQAPASLIPPSQPPSARPSVRPSIPPSISPSQPPSARPSVRPSIPPVDLGAGRFICPQDAPALLALPLARAVTPADLAPVALPVLLVRVLARESVRGVLTLTTADKSTQIHVLDGRACVSKPEHKAATQAFLWREGTYTFEPKDVTLGLRSAISMVRLVVDGLRTLGRTFTLDELENALGDRLTLAPVLKPNMERLIGRFGLGGGEQRLVDGGLDGVATPRDLMRSGIGRHTTLELLLLLTLFGALDWRAPRAVAKASLADELEARARKLVAGNHFEALGVHWSATTEAIESAYLTLRVELDPQGPLAREAKDACARMRERIEQAYAVLRDPTLRIAHRRAEYQIDFDAAADLLEKRATALSMREREHEATHVRSAAEEVTKTGHGTQGRKITMEELLRATSRPPKGEG